MATEPVILPSLPTCTVQPTMLCAMLRKLYNIVGFHVLLTPPPVRSLLINMTNYELMRRAALMLIHVFFLGAQLGSWPAYYKAAVDGGASGRLLQTTSSLNQHAAPRAFLLVPAPPGAPRSWRCRSRDPRASRRAQGN